MSRREPSASADPDIVISGVTRSHKKSAFAEWMSRQCIQPADLADQLGITTSYVRMLRDGSARPGAKLRIRIQERTNGAVRFDAW